VLGAPGEELGAGGAQDPLAELDDQAVLLGDRDEVGRADEPAVRVLPADQGLDVPDGAAGQVDDRLVDQAELVGGGRRW
jgi:hypothetical protein